MAHEYLTEIEVGVCGHSIGLEVEVLFSYEPAEREILYPVDRSQPGSAERVEIESVKVGSLDLFPVLTQEQRDALALEILAFRRAA